MEVKVLSAFLRAAMPRFALFALCRRALMLLALAVAIPAQAGPKIEQWITPAGTKVLWVESRALPMIDIQLDFPAGSAQEPADKAGLAGFTRGLLESGAGELDEERIADKLADTGAQLGGGVDSDRASLRLRTLSAPAERDAAIELASLILQRPTFPEAALAREKARALAALKESLTQPAVLAERRFTAAIYGQHPYGQLSDEATLAAIGRQDLVDFHRRHYRADRAVLSLVGDLDRATAESIAERLTAGLPRGGELRDIAAPVLPERSLIRIEHASAQAHVLIGMPGMARIDPDYFPLLVGNHVLGGGGFVSRLMKAVREERGYAYSVYSYFAPREQAGPFQIGLQTRGAQADAAIAVVEQVLGDFLRDGPTEAELAAARDNLINGFGLRLDSNRKILDHVAMMGWYGLPLDWLERYSAAVAAVSRDAVREAFARRVRPEHLVTVVVGGQGDRAEGAR